MMNHVAEHRNDRRPVFRRCRRPQSIGHSSREWRHISPRVRKHLLPHVCDLGADPAGATASSSGVQGGHVLRPPLLPGTNDIAGKVDSLISLSLAKIKISPLKISD